MTTAGFVLVGGRSRRMGRDKALLPWRSGVLVQDVASKVATVSGIVTLVGNPDIYSRLGFNCVADLRPGLGPLAGLESALQTSRAEYNLVLACDMPDVSVDHLKQLFVTAQRTRAMCVITRDLAGLPHPLCSVFRNTCLPFIRKALDQGRLKMLEVLKELEPEAVVAELAVRNINTVEDWEAFQGTRGF